MCHLRAIREFKLDLPPGNAPIRAKSSFCHPAWAWNFTDYVANNRAPLLCSFKLCVSFQSHHWIQTGVTLRKRPIWVKTVHFCHMWPCNLADYLENDWVPFYASSCMNHFNQLEPEWPWKLISQLFFFFFFFWGGGGGGGVSLLSDNNCMSSNEQRIINPHNWIFEKIEFCHSWPLSSLDAFKLG